MPFPHFLRNACDLVPLRSRRSDSERSKRPTNIPQNRTPLSMPVQHEECVPTLYVFPYDSHPHFSKKEIPVTKIESGSPRTWGNDAAFWVKIECRVSRTSEDSIVLPIKTLPTQLANCQLFSCLPCTNVPSLQ